MSQKNLCITVFCLIVFASCNPKIQSSSSTSPFPTVVFPTSLPSFTGPPPHSPSLVGHWTETYYGYTTDWVFDNQGQVTMTFGSQSVRANYTVDWLAQPAKLDIHSQCSNGATTTIKAIIEVIDPNTVRVQQSEANQPRPTDFDDWSTVWFRQVDSTSQTGQPRPTGTTTKTSDLAECPRFTCTPNPNGRRIAFSSDRSGRGWEIYIMNADGTCVTQLTNLSGRGARRPAWSPNGTKILFEATSDKGLDLYTIDANGGPKRRLTESGTNCDAKWSPDGSQIAFKSGHDKELTLYVMDADGSNRRQLTNIHTLECGFWKWDTQEWNYDWSLDGKQIVFTGIEPTERQQDVYVVKTETGEMSNITKHSARDKVISRVPGENKFLFLSDRLTYTSGITNLLTIYMMNSDGTDLQRIVDLAPTGKSTSPNDDGIPNEHGVRGWVQITTPQLILSSLYDRNIYLLDLACAVKHPPEPGKLPQGCYRMFAKPAFPIHRDNQEPQWMPANEVYWTIGAPLLTFRLTLFPRGSWADEIAIADYNGTGAINLTRCRADDKDPAWSP